MYNLKPHLSTTKSYNELINRLSSSNSHRDVLHTYSSMLASKTPPDAYTFPSLFKACTSLTLLSHGTLIHQHTLVSGHSSDVYVATSIINMYSKLGNTYHARKVFDSMHERNVVPWSAMIACYSRGGDVDMAVCMFNEMRMDNIEPNSVTILCLLAGILEIRQVESVHASVLRLGFYDDVVLMNSMLNVYGKCNRVDTARGLFDSMNVRDIVSWNSLVSGYSLNGYVREAVQLLNVMRMRGMEPDHQTFGSVVSAAANDSRLGLVRLIHGQIIKAGFELDMHVSTTLINTYLKFGYVGDAFRLFDHIEDGDVVSWTALISGLVQNDRADEAVYLFRKMVHSGVCPSTITIATTLAACGQLGSFPLGSSVHGYVVRHRMLVDMTVQNSLVTMYSKCGLLEQSQFIFDRAVDKDVVTWNAIVTGYAQNGHLCDALLFFEEMRMANVRPDFITVVSLLQACASLGALHQGKWVHSFIIRNRVGKCISIDTALIDMYSKCGELSTTQKCFQEMPEHDLVSWSTIIAAYGSHGKGESALRMYYECLRSGIKPNHVTFLAVLSACSHAGFVSQGLAIFKSMTDDFQIEPTLEHRACIVDLLSRSGKVQEAYDFAKRMFQVPSIDVMGILLDASRAYGNDDLGDIIAQEIVKLKPESAGNYVQLARSFASLGKWDGFEEAMMQMRSLGLKKVPGWSSIELQGSIDTFFVDNTSHPQNKEIICMLEMLSGEMYDTYSDHKTDSYQKIS